MARMGIERKVLTSWGEIARYLGVSVKTAQRWRKEKKLPVLVKPVRASIEKLDEWAARSDFVCESSGQNSECS